MLKKFTLSLVAIVMLAFHAFPAPSFAANQVTIANGQLLSNRVLIPLRSVSQNFGATVEWNQDSKTVTIHKGESKILIPTNFKRAVVYSPSNDPAIRNVQRIDLDAPAQLIQGTVYVPMAFVGQSLGVKVSWDQQAKQAMISMNDKQIVVKMEQPAGQIAAAQMISESRLKVLSEQLNKAATWSSVKNLRTPFSPHFTKRLLDSLVKNDGLQYTNPFASPVTSVIYTSKTTASITQSVIFGNDMTGEENYVYDRLSNFVYANGLWKVDQVNFTFRTIPNLGY